MPTKTTSEDFKKGVRAAFDAILFATANNYSGHKKSNEQCQEMNVWLENMAQDALEELSPEDMATWRTAHEMYQKGFEDGQRSKN